MEAKMAGKRQNVRKARRSQAYLGQEKAKLAKASRKSLGIWKAGRPSPPSGEQPEKQTLVKRKPQWKGRARKSSSIWRRWCGRMSNAPWDVCDESSDGDAQRRAMG